MLLLNFARCWLYFKPSSGWWFGTYFIFPYIGSRCHHAQHTPHKGTIHGTKCHACHAKTHLASQPRARVIFEETRPRHIRGKFPRHNRGAFPTVVTDWINSLTNGTSRNHLWTNALYCNPLVTLLYSCDDSWIDDHIWTKFQKLITATFSNWNFSMLRRTHRISYTDTNNYVQYIISCARYIHIIHVLVRQQNGKV
jgi:hypothetical protein